MKLESKQIILPISSTDTFEYLQEIPHYENLMPENTQQFELHDSGQGFYVTLKGFPRVGMKLKETEVPKAIKFESPSDAFTYELLIDISETGNEHSAVQIFFDGKFNPMIEMMAKAPLQKFIDAIIENLEKQKGS